MIKAVLFDLDGTLLDRDASVRGFIDEQYDRLHTSLGHIQKDHYIHRFIMLDDHGYVWKDQVYQQLVAELNITDVSPDGLLQDYLSHFRDNCVPFPNLITMLEVLKQKSIRLGMITNGKGQFQMDAIEALGLRPFFDVILISEWEGMKKPNLEIFQKAVKKLQVQADECLFVGDHPVNDVKGAKDAGMRGVWKRTTYRDQGGADFVIDDLKELVEIVEAQNKKFSRP